LSFIKRLNTLLGARHAEATNPERRAAIRAELAERANDGRPTQPDRLMDPSQFEAYAKNYVEELNRMQASAAAQLT
jgi:hypothetical protein